MSRVARGADEAAFANVHDRAVVVPTKIKTGLAELGDSWEYEGNFVKRCKISQSDLAQFRDGFADFHFQSRVVGGQVKRVWCGTKKFADKLRQRA